MKFLFLINGVPVTDKNGQELQLTFELQSVVEQRERVNNPNGRMMGRVINPGSQTMGRVINPGSQTMETPPCMLDKNVGVLLSAEAQPLWEKAKAYGWVDDDLMPLMSQGKAAILASVIADKLELNPRWTPFESLWHQPALTKKFCQAQLCTYYSSVRKEFARVLM